MRAASPPVKYSVVNHANDLGVRKAIAVKITVQRGKSVVATEAVFSYALNSLVPNDGVDDDGVGVTSEAASDICKEEEEEGGDDDQ